MKLAVCENIKEGVIKLTQAQQQLIVSISLSEVYGVKEAQSVVEFQRHVQAMREKYEYLRVVSRHRNSRTEPSTSESPGSDCSVSPVSSGRSEHSADAVRRTRRSVTDDDISDAFNDVTDLSAQSDLG